MKRREFLSLAAGVVAAPVVAHAQRPKLPLIGFMEVSPGARPDILRGLADNGLIEGRDFRADYKWTEFEVQLLPAQAQDLVQRNPAMIVTLTHAAAFAAKAATRSIPIIFIAGVDPVAIGLVQSLNRPGGNATGFSTLNADLIAKRLEVLRELIPGAKSIAFMSNPLDKATAVGEAKEIEGAARAAGVRLIRANAGNPAEVEKAFVALVKEGAQGLIVSGQFVFFASLSQLGGLSISYKIPAVYATRHYVQAGGLASFGTYVPDGLYQMGVYAARILKGDKPSELPVQQITRTELFINLMAARALSITVPQTLLARADEVIE